jgi:DNA-directed RNA polymerase subunit N (RpoN/RPB10)
MGHVQRLFEPLKCWERERLPQRQEGYRLDLDSTVFERYGEQEGSLKGHHPRKHGRPSHPPLLAVLAEAHFVLHGWLRSGNCGTSRGVVEFLEEALALWQQRQKIRLVRADSGFFEDKLLSFLEQRCLPYMVVTRLTQWVKREAQQIEQWMAVDNDYAVGEFQLRLYNWKAARRFVVVRECVREKRSSLGRKLIDVPGYTFRIFVTSCTAPLIDIWQEYNSRADMENRIEELKNDLGADGFCRKQFFATEAAFRSILLLFNLLAEFQRAAGLPGYQQPASHVTCTSTDLRRDSRPRRSPNRAASLPKLGWSGPTYPFTGPHLELANPNFTEVRTRTHDLTRRAGEIRAAESVRFMSNFGFRA